MILLLIFIVCFIHYNSRISKKNIHATFAVIAMICCYLEKITNIYKYNLDTPPRMMLEKESRRVINYKNLGHSCD